MKETSLVIFKYTFNPKGSRFPAKFFYGKRWRNCQGDRPKTVNDDDIVLLEDAWVIEYSFAGNVPAHKTSLESWDDVITFGIFDRWWEDIIELLESNHKKMLREMWDGPGEPTFNDHYSGQCITVWEYWDWDYPGTLEEPPDSGCEWELKGLLDLNPKPKRKSILDLGTKATGGVVKCSCVHCQGYRGEL